MSFLYNKLNSFSPKTLLRIAFFSMFFWASLLAYLIYVDQYIWAIFAYGIGIIDFMAALALMDRAYRFFPEEDDEDSEYDDPIPEDFGWDERKMDWLPETDISVDESDEEEELSQTLKNSGIDPK